MRDGESLDAVVETIESFESTESKIDSKLIQLNMIVFYATSAEAEQLSEDDRVAYVVRDAERKMSEFPVREYEDTDNRTSMFRFKVPLESTAAAEYSSGVEYYSHLELISKRNFDGSELHDYAPTKTGAGVDCYIVDTGVKFNHTYLKGRVHRCPGFDLNLQGKYDRDNNGHGTYCALFAAGKKCGIAQDAKIYSLKVMTNSGSGYNSHILQAINAVAAHHVAKTNGRPSVLNYSIGMMPSVNYPSFIKDATDDIDDGGDYPTLDALKTATHMGVSVCAAAGNGFLDGSSFMGPMMSTLTNGQMNLTSTESDNFDDGQGLPNVIGAMESASNVYNDDPHKMAIFSNYGKGNTINMAGMHLIAPNAWWSHPSVGTNYAFKSGTSFSSPIMTGLIALHLQVNPTATPLEVKNWLIETATRGNIDNLMEPISIPGGKLVLVDGEAIGKVVLPAGLNLGNDWETIQIVGADGNGTYWFDDWYPVTSMNSSRVKFDMGDESEIDLEVSGDKITISRVENTHGSLDGIKKWQNESWDNLIVKYEQGEAAAYHYIGAVEYTDNLVAFNPYQNYSVEWQNANIIQYDETGVVGDNPSANILTPAAEVPFEVSLEYVSGSLPCDIGIGGPVPNEILTSGTYEVSVKASNGYAEFEKIIGFEYVGDVDPDIRIRFWTMDGITDEISADSYESSGTNNINVLAGFDSPSSLPIRNYFLMVAKTSLESAPDNLVAGCKLASDSNQFEDVSQNLPYVNSDESYHYYSFPWKMSKGITSIEYASS